MSRFTLAAVLLFVNSCGTVQEPLPAQELRDYQTQIEAGIYTGEVTCDYQSRNSVQGLVQSYSYDFTETFVFDESGLPRPGVAFNPDNDQLEAFGTVFEVTNRTFDATSLGCVENASLVGIMDGNRRNGLVTWTFTDAGDDAVLYELSVSWTYRSAGVSWFELEECLGMLTKP